ncbi:hypothetical protein BaRGS_00003843 [Batillaria attramentaria]|uniref:Uncharacterized protein n=1 Tax=Batillaria attramentaria TaxID=370345 RepID=A0ABD0LYW5_9CAEN
MGRRRNYSPCLGKHLRPLMASGDHDSQCPLAGPDNGYLHHREDVFAQARQGEIQWKQVLFGQQTALLPSSFGGISGEYGLGEIMVQGSDIKTEHKFSVFLCCFFVCCLLSLKYRPTIQLQHTFFSVCCFQKSRGH